MSELKPCPFCGGNAALHFAGDKLWVPVYWVKCVECSAAPLDYLEAAHHF